MDSTRTVYIMAKSIASESFWIGYNAALYDCVPGNLFRLEIMDAGQRQKAHLLSELREILGLEEVTNELG